MAGGSNLIKINLIISRDYGLGLYSFWMYFAHTAILSNAIETLITGALILKKTLKGPKPEICSGSF